MQRALPAKPRTCPLRIAAGAASDVTNPEEVRPGLDWHPATQSWARRVEAAGAAEAGEAGVARGRVGLTRKRAAPAARPGRGGASDADDSEAEADEDASEDGDDDADFEAGEEEEEEGADDAAAPRRSGRSTRERYISVGKYKVLRLNNYSLEGGEPSVFDAELRSVDAAEAARESARRRAAAAAAAAEAARRKAAAAAKKAAAPAKRVRSAAETARAANNAAVEAEAAAVAPRRAALLASHMRVLAPFLTPASAAKLRAAAAAAASASSSAPAGSAAAKAAEAVAEAPVPSQITALLREHQLVGFRWLLSSYEQGLHPILGDEMGLGKTLQTICLLAAVTFAPGGGGPHLVVCPLSVLSSWMNELKRWCPALRVVRCHSSDPEERQRLRSEVLADPTSFDVAVTTYEMVKSDNFAAVLQRRFMWRCLVLDEGHRAKCETSLISEALRAVRRRCCILLTGTLLQNNMHELWALLNLLYPDVFTDAAPFDASFTLTSTVHEMDSATLARAHAMLRVLCVRREKADVDLGVPPKVETHVRCPLSALQTRLYRAILLRHSDVIDAMAAGGAAFVPCAADLRKLQNACMQLRLVCGHPLLVDTGGAEAEAEERGMQLREFIDASGKLKVLDRLLSRLKASGHRVVIFSQFTRVLDRLEVYLNERGYQHARLDGSTNRVKRAIDMMLVSLGASFSRAVGVHYCFADFALACPLCSSTSPARRSSSTSSPRAPAAWG
jgi:SWI/SNF-related matrix-associated actin-dependent regulator of chromatin subfamily A member 5